MRGTKTRVGIKTRVGAASLIRIRHTQRTCWRPRQSLTRPVRSHGNRLGCASDSCVGHTETLPGSNAGDEPQTRWHARRSDCRPTERQLSTTDATWIRGRQPSSLPRPSRRSDLARQGGPTHSVPKCAARPTQRSHMAISLRSRHTVFIRPSVQTLSHTSSD